MADTESLTQEVAFLIAAATQQLPGVSVRQLISVLLQLTEGQLTLEGLQRVGARTLRDALPVPTRSADATRAVSALRRGRMPEWCRVHAPSPETQALPSWPNSIRVGFASNEGRWLDASVSRGRRILIYQVSKDQSQLIDVRSLEHIPASSKHLQRRIEPLADCLIVYTLSGGGPLMAALVRAGIHPVRVSQPVTCAHVLQRLQHVVADAPPPWMLKAMGNAAA